MAAKQERLQGLIETARIRARNAYPSGDKTAESGGGGLSPQEQQELDALRKRFGK